MFKKGDTAYFVFQGDFATGHHKGFYCLPGSLEYFPFMPIKIASANSYVYGTTDLSFRSVHIGNYTDWNLPIDLIEKEFSIEKFVMALLEWDGKVSQNQFKSILATL